MNSLPQNVLCASSCSQGSKFKLIASNGGGYRCPIVADAAYLDGDCN